MSLDWVEVASQIENLTSKLKSGEVEWKKRLRHALGLMSSQAETAALQKKISVSKTTWLVAGLSDRLDAHYKPTPCPSEFSVVAMDGSHIDVDRHSPLSCYLINMGGAALHYGESPDARLESTPFLYSVEDMVIVDPGSNREEPIERALLAVKRSVEECRHLLRWVEKMPSDRITLALLDGSLILWGLAGQTFPPFVRETLLRREFLVSLNHLKELSSSGNLATAGYISFPRSPEVVNILRLILCPYELANCDLYCSRECSERERPCDAVARIQDRELFAFLLSPGERSASFHSRSSIVQEYYGEHQIDFFYLKGEEEIARVEVPRWISRDRKLLDRVHALVLDQCRRGQGYPIALSEAHEKAVVTAADREQFWHLVEGMLQEKNLSAQGSAKSRSKRTRWV